MRACLGIDIGGTSIKAALISADGDPLADLTSVPVGDDAVLALTTAAAHARSTVPDVAVIGVGIGSPGYLDAERTMVEYSVNLGWRNFPLVAHMTEVLDLPVLLEGDAFVAAYGEAMAGSGRGHRDVLTVTLGTGVGVGHVIDGQLMVGAHGLAGQAGHIPIPGVDVACPCGRVGCWELVASTAALDHAARAAGYVDARTALADPAAHDIVHAWADAVSTGLIMLSGVLDPGMIVIAGAASQSADAFLPRMRQRLDTVSPQVLLAPATLGGAAGAVGAGMLAWQRFGG